MPDKPDYNRIAGHNVERLAALSDGVFAVAMTLLVLDLKLPSALQVARETELWAALQALSPRLVIYALSFMLLGIFWVGQQTQLNHLARTDRALTWIHLCFLFFVSLTPFSTSLMAEFIQLHIALLAYWLNILCMGATLYFAWGRTESAGLVAAHAQSEIGGAIKQRILVAQLLYAAGAALCAISNWLSLAVILMIQLNYVFAPNWSRFSRRRNRN